MRWRPPPLNHLQQVVLCQWLTVVGIFALIGLELMR